VLPSSLPIDTPDEDKVKVASPAVWVTVTERVIPFVVTVTVAERVDMVVLADAVKERVPFPLPELGLTANQD
jgi:hypothetical protein